MEILLALIAIVAIVGVGYAILYNGLVQSRQKVKEAWSGIDVQLKRRYDLIPNLINTVKGYAAHESQTFEKVVEARSRAMSNNGSPAEQAKDENALSGTLKSIFALSENYPDLKANQNFIELQRQLTETEDQISASRRIYNANVTDLNTKVESFPSNIIANMQKFEKAEFFEIDESEKAQMQTSPTVNF